MIGDAAIGRIALAVVVVLVLVVVVFLVWAHTVLAGERPASLEAWRDPDVTIRHTDASFVIEPAEGGSDVGLVFIPGAQVDPAAYLWKLSGIVAETGATVVITEPTLNLAFFDTRPLSTFTADAPDVAEWYVGGHSLGGVRACQLAATGADAAADPEVAGSCCSAATARTTCRTPTCACSRSSASRTGCRRPRRWRRRRRCCPRRVTVLLEGANHASFGDYGPQPGDGVATASDEETRDRITAAVSEFLAPPS